MGAPAYFDAFISAASTDERHAVWVERTLQEAGLTTARVGAGEPSVVPPTDLVQERLAPSKLLICVVTPSYLASRWCRIEWMSRAPRFEGLLFVRFEDVTLAALETVPKRVDLFDVAGALRAGRLMDALRTEAPPAREWEWLRRILREDRWSLHFGDPFPEDSVSRPRLPHYLCCSIGQFAGRHMPVVAASQLDLVEEAVQATDRAGRRGVYSFRAPATSAAARTVIAVGADPPVPGVADEIIWVPPPGPLVGPPPGYPDAIRIVRAPILETLYLLLVDSVQRSHGHRGDPGWSDKLFTERAWYPDELRHTASLCHYRLVARGEVALKGDPEHAALLDAISELGLAASLATRPSDALVPPDLPRPLQRAYVLLAAERLPEASEELAATPVGGRLQALTQALTRCWSAALSPGQEWAESLARDLLAQAEIVGLTTFGCLILALLELHRRDHAAAVGWLARAEQERPKASSLPLLRGIVLLRRFSESWSRIHNEWRGRMDSKDLDDAGLALGRARELGDRSVEGRVLEGLMHYARASAARESAKVDQYEAAARHLGEAAALVQGGGSIDAPRHALLALAGECWLRARSPRAAQDTLERVPREHRTRPMTTNLIAARIANQEMAKAAAELSRTLTEDPRHVSLTNLGLLLTHAGRPELALVALDQARGRIGEERSHVERLRAHVLIGLERWEDAEAAARVRVELVPHEADAWRVLYEAQSNGSCARLRERAAEAAALRPEFVELRPWADANLQGLGRQFQDADHKVRRMRDASPELIVRCFAEVERTSNLVWLSARRLAALLADPPPTATGCLAAVAEITRGPSARLPQGRDPTAGEAKLGIDVEGVHRSVLGEHEKDVVIAPGAEEVLLRGREWPMESPEEHWRHLGALAIDASASSERVRAYERVSNVDYRRFQEAAVERICFEMDGRAILADEVGLGKTVQAGLVLRELTLREPDAHCLVIVPSHLRSQWYSELCWRIGFKVEEPSVEVAIAGEAGWKRPDAHRVTICDSAWFLANHDALASVVWSMIVVDEAHRVRRPGNSTRKGLGSLRYQRMLLLTATPIQTDRLDLYYLVDLARPALLGSRVDFTRRYCKPGRRYEWLAVDQLRRALRKVMIMRTHLQVGAEVSVGRRVIRESKVDLSPSERDLYDRCAEFVVAGLPVAVDEPIPKGWHNIGRALCSSPAAAVSALTRISARSPDREAETIAGLLADARALKPRAKLEQLRRILDDVRGEPVMVFTEYVPTEAILARELGAAQVPRGIAGAELMRILGAFQAGRGPKVLVASPHLAEGLNLQGCHHLVNFDLPWHFARLEQRIGRIQRIGQKAPEVFIWTLLGSGTLECILYDRIRAQVRMRRDLLGEAHPVVGPTQAEGEWDAIHEVLETIRTADQAKALLGGSVAPPEAPSSAQEVLAPVAAAAPELIESSLRPLSALRLNLELAEPWP